MGTSITSSRSLSRLALRSASSAPRWRSRPWRMCAGPLTMTMAWCPSASRWVTASSPPVRLSTATEQMSGSELGWSSSTTDTPRRCNRRIGSRDGSLGVISTPCTRCSASSSRCRISRCADSSLLHRMTAWPAWLATSSTPRATSVKNGLATSNTTRPMARAVPARSWRADSLRTKPRSLMALSTRARVAWATRSGWLSTLETVPTDTPARTATSRMLTEDLTLPPARQAVRERASETSQSDVHRMVAGMTGITQTSCDIGEGY